MPTETPTPTIRIKVDPTNLANSSPAVGSWKSPTTFGQALKGKVPQDW
ncbi:MAG: hypothetical protein IT422_00725 [Pirellulaceae bacterium]|nr:hypothetical protein [Pirellulaceae bacterium]